MHFQAWQRWTALIVASLLVMPVAGLAILSLCSRRPANLGLIDERLADCPDKPNCVCSQASRESQLVAPIEFEGSADDAIKRLKQVMAAMPNTSMVAEQPDYLHFECTSRVFRFVDDLEFLVDPQRHIIYCRSASRAGYSDLGVNRRRVEAIRRAFEAVGQGK